MARRSQCSNAGDNPLDPNYLPPHYREEYRLAIDALLEEDVDGYYQFLQKADVVDFLSRSEIEYIQGSVQLPQQDVGLPELRYMDSSCDGSSDTYWPLHSDTDAPGLDLGWPDLHRFIGPTEVTTLVNPAEPDMPSIKEQARRLIKHAQQVVAVVMDVFTDVDIFADILAAASRNVAVYIILDEQNAHHFVNMVLNCRVHLESVQFLRVRTVSGITYRCRSGATFKGQMMDRFLLTDCRAVLSGNYSFMWSFEKLHRCLAHLFLGQLVTTFDEEFRILYAQSQPLIMENVLAQMEEFGHMSNRQFNIGRTPLYREPKKFLPMNTTRSDNWARPSFDERMDMDWKQQPLSRHESIQRLQDQGPGDMYNRYAPQQLRMDQPYEPGSARMPINLMESVGFKRHSYAEGSPGRHSPYQFMQHSGMPNFDPQGRQFQREQQPYPRAGPEAGYSGYDRYRGQGYHPMDQYPPEPGFPQEMEPHDSFEHVRNYLSSNTNVEMDQESDNLLPPGDAPFGSSYPKRLSVGQPYACQTSPTAPNPPDQKQPLQVSSTNRKDPSVKQGLRDWRISSYLSAYDDAGDEDPAVPITMATDPFEEPPNPMQRRSSGPELSVPKIPNTREFKIPAVPRASQLPSYMKLITPEPSKKLPDEIVTMEAEIKTTPTTPSESSSTTDVEKAEEVEPDEPKETVVRREESFRRKHNPAVQRNSRLRSSLIFSSQLEQQDSEPAAPGQPEEEVPKTEERPDLPFLSRVLGQRRSLTRTPFEWSRYKKSNTFDTPSTEASKADDANKAETKDLPKEETPKVLPGHIDVKGPSKPAAVEQTQVSQPEKPILQSQNPDQVVLPKTTQPVNPPAPLLSNSPYVDMNDPEARFRFFKELAAKRKAEKSSEKAPVKPPSESTGNTSVEPVVTEVSKNLSDSSDKKPSATTVALPEKNMTPKKGEGKISTETCGAASPLQGRTDKIAKSGKQENKPKQMEKGLSTDSEKIEQKNSHVSLPLVKPPSEMTGNSSVEPVVTAVSKNLSDSSNKKPSTTTEALPEKNMTSEKGEGKTSTETCGTVSPHQGGTDKIAKSGKQENKPKQMEKGLSTDSEKIEQKNSHVSLPLVKPPSEMTGNSSVEPVVTAVSKNLSDSSNKKPSTTTEALPEKNMTSEKGEGKTSTETCGTVSPHQGGTHNIAKTDKQQNKPKLKQKSLSTDSEKIEHKNSQVNVPSPISTGCPSKLSSELKPLSPVTTEKKNVPPSPTQAHSVTQRNAKKDSKDSNSTVESSSFQDIPPASGSSLNVPPDSCTKPSIPQASSSSPNIKPASSSSPIIPPVSSSLPKTTPESSSSLNIPSNSCAPHSSVSEPLSSHSTPSDFIYSPPSTTSKHSTPPFPHNSALCPKSDKIESNESVNPSSMKSSQMSVHASPETTLMSDLTQGEPSSTTQSTSCKLPSALHSGQVESNVLQSLCANDAESNTASFKASVEAENKESHTMVQPGPAKSLLSPKVAETESNSTTDEVSVESMPSIKPILSPNTVSLCAGSLPPDNLQHTVSHPHTVCDAKSSDLSQHPDKTGTSANTPTKESSPGPSPAETVSVPNPALGPHISTKSSTVSPDASTILKAEETNCASELITTDSSLSNPSAAEPCNTSDASVCDVLNVLPQHEKSEPVTAVNTILSDSSFRTKTSPTDSGTPKSPLTESTSSNICSTELTSKETAVNSDPNRGGKTTTEAKTNDSQDYPSKPPIHVEIDSANNHCEVSRESDTTDSASEKKVDETDEENKTDADTVVTVQKAEDTSCPGTPGEDNGTETTEGSLDETTPQSPQSKTPKGSQSRYHSSTAGVLASSNLRDDTKILLEQISVNSQSRTEPTKEPAVTDDEKEDDKSVSGDRGLRLLGRLPHKTQQEREKLLEKIQTMRKERKVYSRFEMAP